MKIVLKPTADTSRTYPVAEILLNGKPLTDYVLVFEGGSVINWSQALFYLEKRLAELAGYQLSSAAAVTDGAPVITFGMGVKPYRAETGYRVTVGENGVSVAFGSTVGALTGLLVWLEKNLPAIAAGALSLTLSDCEGECGKQSALVPLGGNADIRAMTFNVLGVGDRADLISATVVAHNPDFAGMQEYFSGAVVASNLRRAGYKIACEKINAAAPYSIRTNNVKYERIGINCCTPIFYRAAEWELIEENAHLFHWQNRCPHTPTKSLALAVFESKNAPQKKVLVVNFHAALVLPDYQNHYLRFPEGEHCRPGLSEKQGKIWRLENNKEILRLIDEMREKYEGLTVVLMGDMNGKTDEESIQLFVKHRALTHMLAAPEAHCDSGPTFHPVGKATYPHSVPIDHIFVTHDTAMLTACRVARDQLSLDSSDHCPTMVDLALK